MTQRRFIQSQIQCSTDGSRGRDGTVCDLDNLSMAVCSPSPCCCLLFAKYVKTFFFSGCNTNSSKTWGILQQFKAAILQILGQYGPKLALQNFVLKVIFAGGQLAANIIVGHKLRMLFRWTFGENPRMAPPDLLQSCLSRYQLTIDLCSGGGGALQWPAILTCLCLHSPPIKQTALLSACQSAWKNLTLRLSKELHPFISAYLNHGDFEFHAQFAGCPESWKILGRKMLASVVLAATGILSTANAAPQLFGPSPSIPSRTSAVPAPRW